MAELCPLQDLPQDSAHCVFVQTIGTLLQLVQNCVVYKLKDQVQPLLPPEHLNQIHQVVVPQLLQYNGETLHIFLFNLCKILKISLGSTYQNRLISSYSNIFLSF